MKRYTCVFALLAALLATLALPSAALAETSHFRGKTAYGDFYSFDPTGCISTSVYIFATESRSQVSPGGGSADGTAASISIYQYNDCTYEEVACLYGSISPSNSEFNIAGNLASATLNATFEAYNCLTGAAQPVSAAMTWTGEGDVSRGSYHNSYSFGGYRYSYRSSGQSRFATLSGSVTFGGTTLNLENDYYSYGALSVSSGGTIYNNH
ncbi:MAG TPA: hypothetical protein VKM72_04065 [Thermoanaerobaculia bacterium]|nr:hypothetical protein [Thermoanaerobaculia bacterium]